MTEICICAAIKMESGLIIRGQRHDDCILTAIKMKLDERVTQAKQGFLTSNNRFVDRKEAMIIMKKLFPGLKGDILFSEDLY